MVRFSKRYLLSSLVAVAPFWLPGMARADAKVTAQTMDTRLVQWVEGGPRERREAREWLISLKRDDLDALRAAVESHLSLIKLHEDLLHDVVSQVFLANEPYASNAKGFLGISFDFDQTEGESPYEGVEIRHIVPGLAASRFLIEGDIVYKIKFADLTRDIAGANQFRDIVGSLPRGHPVNFTVLRRGRILSIDGVLGGTPEGEINLTIGQFVADRQALAEAYWAEHFTSLFEERPTTRAAAGR